MDIADTVDSPQRPEQPGGRVLMVGLAGSNAAGRLRASRAVARSLAVGGRTDGADGQSAVDC
jgi:hypothetical protein